MPKETFFRLPKEKQERLLEAARIEFSRVPLQDAAIANIVKLADVSRGSFYQYFEDKEDLYYYYFDVLRLASKRDYEVFLKEEKGDLFRATTRYFSRWSEEAICGPNAAFYKNLFLYLDYQGTSRVSPEIARDDSLVKLREQRVTKHKEKMVQLMEMIDTSKLKVTTDKELIILIRILTSMMFGSINHAYKQEIRGEKVDLEELKQEFSTKLGWLQYGVNQNEVGGNK